MTAPDRVHATLGTGLALPGAAEYETQRRRLYDRVAWLCDRWLRARSTWLSPNGAALLASFSLGAWAQRYPVQSYDLGEDAALFIARWMVERALPVTADHMHAALDEWRLRQLAEQVGAAQAKHDARGTIDFVAEALAEIGGSRNEVTISAAAPERRPMNRQERRAERSRRRRG